MAHRQRQTSALALLDKVGRMPFIAPSIIWDRNNDEWDTGKRSLEWGVGRGMVDHSANIADWHIVLQDDAIISDNFYENVCNALEKVPTRSLVSLYTGTVRPFPSRIEDAVVRAQEDNASWLVGNSLYWGVGIAIPMQQIEAVLQFVQNKNLKYDERIGFYYKSRHLPVYYTNPSVVDHDYTLGSLIGNDYEGEPRQARNYSPDVCEWNDTSIKIQ